MDIEHGFSRILLSFWSPKGPPLKDAGLSVLRKSEMNDMG